MSKARRSALHRTGKRIDKHVGQCQREHAKMQTAIINAFLHALSPYLSEEEVSRFRRTMNSELVRRKHK